MHYKRVGKTGWQVASLGFGCMRFHDAESAAASVRRAIELGVNYFDVAPAASNRPARKEPAYRTTIPDVTPDRWRKPLPPVRAG